ncbi:MAG: gliding motility-associated ABC transporter ATP-binding subunit GldA [Bacteroidales bacterium]|nr:gliding motility-associated ABC transporter ATP-binding subunit GldA [Bacteroidales bacterium]MBR5778974.1 gliding motility-associated ABC transporter ATP-binding subunit GldA [Bacteroidales bacterium]
MSINVENITKVYGTQKALDQVSFSIKEGEIVGLLGPNGAGKSTLMKIITCFIPPTSGNVNVCGYNIFDNPLDIRKNIGYLPEHNPLYLEMYVREFLIFVAGIYGIKNNTKQRVEEIIELTGLTKEANKKIGQLSKGYRQRVGIAQALIHDPKVLILDEPTTGLDPNQLEEIRQLIKKVGETKIVMLSTHIMQEVEAICSRVIIINSGKIVADDKTENLQSLQNNSNQYFVEFNKEINTALIKQHLKDITNVIYNGKNSYTITTKTNNDIRENIFKWAVDNNLMVLTIRKNENNLEKIFHDLTSK